MAFFQIVAGGGAIEMELSKTLREHSRTIKGKGQMLVNAYAKALEVKKKPIPIDGQNKFKYLDYPTATLR